MVRLVPEVGRLYVGTFGYGTAWMSTDNEERFLLTREFRVGGRSRRRRRFVFVGVNPSTADHVNDDATIRRLGGFALRYHCSELYVVNLFSLRATDPKRLLANGDEASNYEAWETAIATKHVLVALGWGRLDKLPVVVRPAARRRVEHLLGMLAKRRVRPYCLGVTKDGDPKHPLYLASSTSLGRWRRNQ